MVLLDATDGRAGAAAPGQRLRRWFVEFSGDGSRVATVSSQNQEAHRLVRRHGSAAGSPSRSARAGRASTSRRTARPSTRPVRRLTASLGPRRRPPVPVPGCDASKPAELGPVGHAKLQPGTRWRARRPTTRGSGSSSSTSRPGLRRPSRSGDTATPASAAGTPTASTTPSPPAARSGSGMRGTKRARRAGCATLAAASSAGSTTARTARRLVIAELSGRVTMLDPATLAPIGRPVQLGQPVGGVAAGPDNRTAIVLTGRLDASGILRPVHTHGLVPGGPRVRHGARRGRARHRRQARGLLPGRSTCRGGRDRDGEVLVLDLRTGAAAAAAGCHRHTMRHVARRYSPDGARILASGACRERCPARRGDRPAAGPRPDPAAATPRPCSVRTRTRS